VTDCFRCGDDEHLSADCPNTTPRKRAPAAIWPPAMAGPERPDIPPPPPRRPDREIADPQPRADSIRDAMGWSRHHVDDRLRELAARQMAESRRDPRRFYGP
jgi:hypothetical protein